MIFFPLAPAAVPRQFVLLSTVLLLSLFVAPSTHADLLDQLGLSQKKKSTGTNAPASGALAALSQDQMVGALKEALGKGVQQAVGSLGKDGGFLNDLNVKIPLPESMKKVEKTLRTLRQEMGVAEVVILSTCNRTEVYWAGSATGAELTTWLERHHGNDLDLASSLYVHQEQRAVEHAFSVASGLDSMVLGEAQILGQLKDAYRVAQQAGSTGPALNKLFQAAFSAAKRVRSETRIGENAVSIASAAVSLARRVYSDLSKHTAQLVGAGEMNALAARHFASAGVKRMVIANRTLSRARTLAAELKANAVGLEELATELAQADIVIACTASLVPLITKSAAAAAIRTRRRRPIFMVDLGVPRDIEPSVADLEDVYLFSIDDLQQLIDMRRLGLRFRRDDVHRIAGGTSG